MRLLAGEAGQTALKDQLQHTYPANDGRQDKDGRAEGEPSLTHGNHAATQTAAIVSAQLAFIHVSSVMAPSVTATRLDRCQPIGQMGVR